ncbi:hypothetical protein M8818_000454 [Zalaria obscura]|uniref:Uncharacterized protein n=1 Tax=Zalaria obscura TaxID=2024903 RepID=A0ACC3SRG1_9PEZI
MADPRPFIAVIILLFILFSPDPQSPANHPSIYSRLEEAIAEESHALSNLESSHFGDFNPLDNRWLNISGYRKEQDYAWVALDKVKERAREQVKHAIGEDYIKRIDGDNGGSTLPFYQNVSGVLHGSWVRSPLSSAIEVPRLNMSAFAPEGPFGPITFPTFGRNLTGTEGKMSLHVSERDGERNVVSGSNNDGREVDLIRSITVEMTVQDDESFGDGWEVKLHGVHFLETGGLLLATTTEKFRGIFGLPHLAMSEYQFGITQKLLNKTLTGVINKQSTGYAPVLNPWSPGTDNSPENQFSTPNCELVVYMQEQPMHIGVTANVDAPSTLLRFMEQELRFPTGASLPPAPELQFSLTAFSPDCGFAFESKGPPDFVPQEGQHINGPKIEVQHIRGRRHILFFGSVLALQLWLLTRQLREASTPSTRSRVSFYTISMLALGDGFTTMSFCLVSLFVDGLWVPLIGAAFLSFMSVSFFGMRFLMDIWAVQQPEREQAERQRRAAASSSSNADNAARSQETQDSANGAPPTVTNQAEVHGTAPTADTLPLPVTARRPVDTGATPIIIPSDQDEPVGDEPTTTVTDAGTGTNQRAPGFGAMYTRFYILLLVTLFLSLNATTWPHSLRRGYFTLLAFLYLSFWTPQIYRNAWRNCRHALRWDFVAGQSVLRLMPFAYFYGFRTNVLFAEVDLIDLAILAAWVWIQAILLVSQEILGPRWFARGDWFPPAYDYHPVLRQDEEGGNMPIGFSQATSPSSPTLSAKPGESRDNGKWMFDCAICMQELEVPVVGAKTGADAGLGGGLLARRQYMTAVPHL